MNRQIVQIFHRFISRKNKTAGQAEEHKQGRAWDKDAAQYKGAAGRGDAAQYKGAAGRGSAAWYKGAAQDGPDLAGSGDGRGVVRIADRKSFERAVNESIRRAAGHGCLLISDVDRYREIGALHGREAAEAVYRYAADVLSGQFDRADGSEDDGVRMIGRADRDTFTLWLPAAEKSDAEDIRRRIGIVNDRLLHTPDRIPPATVSVGVSFCGAEDDCRSLVRKAYKALCLVKESGRCGCEIV